VESKTGEIRPTEALGETRVILICSRWAHRDRDNSPLEEETDYAP